MIWGKEEVGQETDRKRDGRKGWGREGRRRGRLGAT